jgi:hypothetical protein
MAGSNTAPKLEIEENSDKTTLTLTMPGKPRISPNNILPFRKNSTDSRTQAQLLNKDRIKNRNANKLGSTAMDENEADIAKEHKTKTDPMKMDKEELEDRHDAIARDRIAHPLGQKDESVSQNENTGGNIPKESYGNIGGEEENSPKTEENDEEKIKNDTPGNDAESPDNSDDLNSQQQQAKNEIAKNGEGKTQSSAPESPDQENQSTNPKNDIEKARAEKAKNEEKKEDPAVDMAKKVGKKAIKKWIIGVAISIGATILPWIIGACLVILLGLASYQVSRHPGWTIYYLLTGQYGSLAEVLFEMN